MPTPTNKDVAYNKAVSDATTVFLKTMQLHGFARKDDFDEFHNLMSKAVCFSFFTMRGGPDPDAPEIIKEMLEVEYKFPKKPLDAPIPNLQGVEEQKSIPSPAHPRPKP